MKSRKLLLALAASAAGLAGCASDPYWYDTGYYYDQPTYYSYSGYPSYYYYPRYYTGPSVSLGFGYHRYR